MALAGPIQQEEAMALQFLVGFVVSAINIMIHALVTVGAVGLPAPRACATPSGRDCT